ncbi:MAG: Ig-like domain-containing protein [Deltaproteobacteria bacterium]|nr:Ig-like domain-containing protein [Deltaproteobacteria bacterium]
MRPLRAASASFALNTGRRILVRVFVDRDQNGVFSNGDRGVSVEEVAVEDAAGNRVGDGPARNGLADFTGLKPGVYTVWVDTLGLPAGYVNDSATEQTVDLERSRHVVLHYPVRPLRNIGGTVFLDMPFNGHLTDRDQPAANVVVTLSDGQQRLTDANGRFLFRNLAEGAFEVRVIGAQRDPVVHMHNGPADVLDLRILVTDHAAIKRALAGDPLVPEEEPDDDEGGFGLPEPPAVVEVVLPDLMAILIDPPAAFLTSGQSASLTPIGLWSNEERIRIEDPVSWSSSNPEVASVNADGRVTAVAFGFTEITAERAGVRSPAVLVEVADVPLVGLQLDTPMLRLNPGDTETLTATALFVDGRIADVSRDVRWRSEDEAVAEVSEDGRVRAAGRGETRVFADFWDMTAFPTTVVVAPPPVALAVVQVPKVLLAGRKAAVKAVAEYADGSRADVTSFAQWTSSDPRVLEVGQDGVLAALAPGSATVTAGWQGVTAEEAGIEAVAGPVAGMQRRPHPSSVLERPCRCDSSRQSQTVAPSTSRARSSGPSWTRRSHRLTRRACSPGSHGGGRTWKRAGRVLTAPR